MPSKPGQTRAESAVVASELNLATVCQKMVGRDGCNTNCAVSCVALAFFSAHKHKLFKCHVNKLAI